MPAEILLETATQEHELELVNQEYLQQNGRKAAALGLPEEMLAPLEHKLYAQMR